MWRGVTQMYETFRVLRRRSRRKRDAGGQVKRTRRPGTCRKSTHQRLRHLTPPTEITLITVVMS